MGLKKRLDLRNREPVLHDVEQEVAAAAGGREILERRHTAVADQILPARPDVVGDGPGPQSRWI